MTNFRYGIPIVNQWQVKESTSSYFKKIIWNSVFNNSWKTSRSSWWCFVCSFEFYTFLTYRFSLFFCALLSYCLGVIKNTMSSYFVLFLFYTFWVLSWIFQFTILFIFNFLKVSIIQYFYILHRELHWRILIGFFKASYIVNHAHCYHFGLLSKLTTYPEFNHSTRTFKKIINLQ